MTFPDAAKLVKNAQPSVITGRKWNASEAVQNAESVLKMKEVIGNVAIGRSGLGLHPHKCWSKESISNKRKMVSEEIYHFEEDKLNRAHGLNGRVLRTEQSRGATSNKWGLKS